MNPDGFTFYELRLMRDARIREHRVMTAVLQATVCNLFRGHGQRVLQPEDFLNPSSSGASSGTVVFRTPDEMKQYLLNRKGL